jgi:C4-type Zn-finger protein
MSVRYLDSIEVLEHGNTFVAENLRGLSITCPECKEKLESTDVTKSEPYTRHTVDLTKESTLLVTVFCSNCGCTFRATVKDR